MDTLSEANGTFAVRLLKILCQDNPSHNVFYSPLSVSSALAMVLLGAKGNTAVQMAQALCLNTEEDIHEAFYSLLTEVNKPGTQYLLRMANRLFGRNTGDFFTTFKESCFQFYHAELEQMPSDAEESRKHINTWVSKQTEGKIQELLSSGSIAADTSLVLVNAIYFQGSWEQQFYRECTKEMPFKINQREQRPVQMMSQEDMFNIAYVSELQLQVLELPYADQELSMLVLLPAEGVDLSTVEENLTFEKLTAWTKPGFMTNTTVDVFLPKFKLQEEYSMKSVLQHLGMVDVFQEDKVDLSAMSPKGNLFLSKFVHKSIVEVTEEGTEAAAASASVSEDCLVDEEPTSFCADHPFLFFIRHNTANSLLFCGRFLSP